MESLMCAGASDLMTLGLINTPVSAGPVDQFPHAWVQNANNGGHIVWVVLNQGKPCGVGSMAP